MQPYQTATQEIKRQGELPQHILKRSVEVGLGGAAISTYGRGLAQKALNLVNKYVPENLAIKGLEKLDPRMGKFIKTAMNAGMTWDEIGPFIGEQAEKGLAETEENQKDVQDSRNLIEKHSPELHQFISQEMKKGRSHKEAGALAKIGTGGKNFNSVIEKLMKEHKSSWENILDAVYGQQGAQESQAQQPSMQQAQAPQGQSGPGQQALMDILNKINQKMGQ